MHHHDGRNSARARSARIRAAHDYEGTQLEEMRRRTHEQGDEPGISLATRLAAPFTRLLARSAAAGSSNASSGSMGPKRRRGVVIRAILSDEESMRWRQLKTVVERDFAPELAGRLQIHTSGYSTSTWGRSWMTFDGTEFVCFADDGAYTREGRRTSPIVSHAERTPRLLVERGEFSSGDFKMACFRYNDLTVADAIGTGEPLLVALACTNRTTGADTLRQLVSGSDLHPLVCHIIELRSLAWAGRIVTA